MLDAELALNSSRRGPYSESLRQVWYRLRQLAQVVLRDPCVVCLCARLCRARRQREVRRVKPRMVAVWQVPRQGPCFPFKVKPMMHYLIIYLNVIGSYYLAFVSAMNIDLHVHVRVIRAATAKDFTDLFDLNFITCTSVRHRYATWTQGDPRKDHSRLVYLLDLRVCK